VPGGSAAPEHGGAHVPPLARRGWVSWARRLRPRVRHSGDRSRSVASIPSRGRLAQPEERRPYKAEVAGSRPAAPTRRPRSERHADRPAGSNETAPRMTQEILERSLASAKRRRVATGIYELERGTYELVVSRGRGPDGRYHQRTERFRGNLRDAKRARAGLLTSTAARTSGNDVPACGRRRARRAGPPPLPLRHGSRLAP
jgi:hypothetical protein